jgi:transposase
MEKEFFKSEELQKLYSAGNPESAYNTPVQKKVVFKEYDTSYSYIFPASTDDYISKTHIARFVSTVIDKVGIDFLIDKYKGGGASAYHPAMLLKVWILGCIYRIYSCRKLELALWEQLPFIWISGNQRPDFRTLNNFRLLLEEDIKEVFRKVIRICIDMGIIDCEEIFIDHTKIEANANRHKITWRKTVEKQLGKYEIEIDQLFKYINELNLQEEKESAVKPEVREWNEEDLNKAIDIVSNQIKEKQLEKEEGKEIKKSIRRAKIVLEKKEQYEEKLKILGERNSYSNSDHDATAMMQKDKVMIKPGYNEGIAATKGFVVNYEISQKSSDNSNFIEIVEGIKENTQVVPEVIHTDGAYGNEENMSYLEEEGIGNYLKYGTYQREKSKKWHQEKVRREDFIYEQENDRYRCVNGKYLCFTEEKEITRSSGYKKRVRQYKALEQDCSRCPFKGSCTKGKSRGIEISEKYERLKNEARNNLDSERGKELRRRRGFEVETVFGDRKENNQRRRFLLRGKAKVLIESGIYYTSHNLRKLYRIILRMIIEGFRNNQMAIDYIG